MPETVALLSPYNIDRNPDNPRLIFRREELASLEQSIADQGILVPLTVYREGSSYRLLDGERRLRCAIRLGLEKVPAIVQPKPHRLANLMMMFAIHYARLDWFPLPTALKLRDLEDEFQKRHSRSATESELAGLASMSRGEVRRLKKLLGLPEVYRTELLSELEKPRSKQVLTVDHVLEATTAASLLKKKGILDSDSEDALRRAIVDKFKDRTIENTVAPRKFARLARAVERNEISAKSAQKVLRRFILDPTYSVDDAFRDSVEKIDFEHSIEQQAQRLEKLLKMHGDNQYDISPQLADHLRRLAKIIRGVLAS